MEINEELLHLLEADARIPEDRLALMLGKEVGEIRDMVRRFEEEHVILGYKAVIDWDKTGDQSVTALIEVKITPQRDRGFSRVAQKIYNYPEVQSLYLMSGAFDFSVIISGKTMKEVAYFVAMKLAPIEDVISTSTHFVLRKYKDNGVIFIGDDGDERTNV